MKKSILRWIVALAIVFPVTPIAASQEREPVRIGVLYPLTGPQSAVGRECLRGIQIAANMVNDWGGIWNGRKIELITGDASDTEAARTEAERLCTVEKVKCIIGVYSSNLAFVAHPTVAKHNVFFWESNAVANRLRQLGHQYTFFFGPTASTCGEGSAHALRDVVCPALSIEPKDLRIAVVYQGTEWGKSQSYEGFIKKARQLGMQIVLDTPYDPKTLDFTSLIQKIKMKKPDVVVQQSYVDDGFRLFRDARKNNLNPKVWLGNGSVWANVPEAFDKFGSDMNFLLDTHHVPGGSISHLSPKTQFHLREFHKRYEETYKVRMQADAIIGFTAAIALFEYVLPPAGSLDPEKLAEVAHSIALPHTATLKSGGIRFSLATAEYANQNVEAGVFVRQIFNGKFYTIWPKEAAELEVIVPTPPYGDREISDIEVDKHLLIPKELIEY